MVKRKRTEGQTMIYKHYTKTKDRATGTPLKTCADRRCSGRVAVLVPLETPVVLLLILLSIKIR